MKSIILVFIIFMFYVETAYMQATTPLVPPTQKKYRPKKDPKGGCGLPPETPLDFNVKLDFPLIDGKVVTEIVSSTRYNVLIFGKEGRKIVARLNYYVRFAAARDRQVVGSIEIGPRIILNESELADIKTQSYLVRHFVDLPPGSYIVDIFLRDVQSGCWGVATRRFAIPEVGATNPPPA